MGQRGSDDLSRMELHSAGVRLLAALVGCFLLATYIALIFPVYRAQAIAEGPHDFQRASRLQPRNAEYHYRIAVEDLFVNQDARAAMSELHAALTRNSTSARYWLTMANTAQVLGDDVAEQQALKSALLWDPTTPDIAWRAALFYIVRGDAVSAMPLFRIVVANDPENAAEAISTSWRATRDPERVVDQVLPASAGAYLKFIDILCADGQDGAARQVWQKLVDRNLSPDPHATFHYLWFLYQHGEADQARKVWQQTAALNRDFAPYVASDNLITNSGFEMEILDGGFDWHFTAVPGVHVNFDSNVFHSGARSLQVHFDGPSVGPVGMEQLIPVKGGTTYELSAYERSEELVTASGPRLLLSDAFTGHPYAMSDPSTGTSPWQPWRQTFTTAPSASFLTLKIVRSPAEPLIQGSFWVDDVSLVPVQVHP